jgi:non-ribosomal peptide synthetase component F
MKEVVLLYEGFVRGHDIPLPVPPPYREYIAWWQRQDFAEAEDYWRKRLRGFTMPTPLPFERGSNQEVDEKTRAGERRLHLSRSTTLALERLSRREQLTLNTILQGAWALLLSRYCGERDVVYGTVVSGRSASIANIESMVGLFINTLPVRVRVEGESDLLSWLAELNQQLVQLQQYEHTPLARVVQASDVPRGVALFESLFVFENYPVDSALRRPQGALRVSDPQLSERGNHQLGVLAGPGEELEVRICFDRTRFADEAMTRVANHLKTLLEGIAADPRRRLSQLPMLSEAERGQVAPTAESIEEVIL